MGTAVSGETELIRLTAVDYFSQETLIDQLVKPSVPMKHFNTRYSGVSGRDMFDAVRHRKCIFGRDAARAKLWNFVGTETVVVVHGGQGDLSALRWIHPFILDTCILDANGVMPRVGRSLKKLCSEQLNLEVQTRRAHDSHEDAMACRELAHSWAQWIPDLNPSSI